MFDNPKEELRRLEAALLAIEPDGEEEDDFSEDYCEDLEGELIPGRNPAVEYGRIVYADEEDIYAAAPVSRREQRKAKKQEKLRRKKERKESRKKRTGFFRFLFSTLVKIAVILILLGWFLQWLT